MKDELWPRAWQPMAQVRLARTRRSIFASCSPYSVRLRLWNPSARPHGHGNHPRQFLAHGPRGYTRAIGMQAARSVAASCPPTPDRPPRWAATRNAPRTPAIRGPFETPANASGKQDGHRCNRLEGGRVGTGTLCGARSAHLAEDEVE
eukprot:425180-Prymnesium_polylepis.1